MFETIQDANWTVHVGQTETAGLRLHLCDYRGARVIFEACLPWVVVDHAREEVAVEDSPLPAHGPLWIPLGRRTLVDEPRIVPFPGGFEVLADYARGPYHFTQLYRFHESGRFDPWLILHGPGLHPRHTYHPHWRFDFDVGGAGDNAFEHWDEGWTRAATEGWFPATGAAPDGTVWRQVDFASGRAITLRPHQWEDAEVFAVRYHEGELTPPTPFPGPGGQVYPAAYLGEEPLDGADVALWYVAHVHYDQGFPFTAGPWAQVEG